MAKYWLRYPDKKDALKAVSFGTYHELITDRDRLRDHFKGLKGSDIYDKAINDGIFISPLKLFFAFYENPEHFSIPSNRDIYFVNEIFDSKEALYRRTIEVIFEKINFSGELMRY